jgi:hypothetical protein
MPIHLKTPGHNRHGPDGQGWNRLSITGGANTAGDQCALQPRDYPTLVESRDTRRARYGGYGSCGRAGDCDGCPIYTAPATELRRPGEDRVLVRIDPEGRPCVMVSPETGWEGRYYIKPWRWLASLEGWNVGRRADDEHSEAFWLIRADAAGDAS